MKQEVNLAVKRTHHVHHEIYTAWFASEYIHHA